MGHHSAFVNRKLAMHIGTEYNPATMYDNDTVGKAKIAAQQKYLACYALANWIAQDMAI